MTHYLSLMLMDAWNASRDIDMAFNRHLSYSGCFMLKLLLFLPQRPF